MPELIPITPQLAELYKEVRLRALQADPFGFGSTYAREAQFADEVWHERITRFDGIQKIGFLALDAGKLCGLVGCFLDEQDPTQATVISMWVAPSHRGTGLSSTLLDAIRTWAHSRGASTLRLTVVSSNNTAIKFYERYGFTKTGRTEPYPNDPQLFEFEMTRPTTDIKL